MPFRSWYAAIRILSFDVCARCRALLSDDATFATTTLEDLLDTGALPAPTVTALRARYLPE